VFADIVRIAVRGRTVDEWKQRPEQPDKEHRDMKVEGLSHDDVYRRNALAAMLRPHQIEFRDHSSLSNSRVLSLGRSFFDLAKIYLALPFSIHYQRKVIGVVQSCIRMSGRRGATRTTGPFLLHVSDALSW
jgi:hypothetical protein